MVYDGLRSHCSKNTALLGSPGDFARCFFSGVHYFCSETDHVTPIFGRAALLVSWSTIWMVLVFPGMMMHIPLVSWFMLTPIRFVLHFYLGELTMATTANGCWSEFTWMNHNLLGSIPDDLPNHFVGNYQLDLQLPWLPTCQCTFLKQPLFVVDHSFWTAGSLITNGYSSTTIINHYEPVSSPLMAHNP